MWRVEFNNAITSQVVSNDNPQGRLTNSDLKMATILLQYMVLHQEVEMQFAHTTVRPLLQRSQWRPRRGSEAHLLISPQNKRQGSRPQTQSIKRIGVLLLSMLTGPGPGLIVPATFPCPAIPARAMSSSTLGAQSYGHQKCNL
jgi:hypothetical protein